MIIEHGEHGCLLVGPLRLIGDEAREMAWAERHLRRDPDIGWVLGNYVEADNPNDNGHIFPLDDLRAARDSLLHKPLNMLHQAKYVVGAFVAAELTEPSPPNATAAQAGGLQVTTTGWATATTNVTTATLTAPHPILEGLAAFWRHNFPEEYELVRRAQSEGSCWFCVDDETELLTARGWRRREELVIGEDVFTLNTAMGRSEFQPLSDVHAYPVIDVDLVRMEGMMHSSLTTPNHRWWVERKSSRGGRTREWRRSDRLTQLTAIPRAVPRCDFPTEAKHSDAFVELVAWFWTEGTVRPDGRSVIYQSFRANGPKCVRIEAALADVFGSPGRAREGLWYARDHDVRHYCLDPKATAVLVAVAPDCVPTGAFLSSLTQAQLDLFIRTSIAGDGTVAVRDGQTSLSQSADNERGLRQARAFEMACALAGIPTNTSRQSNHLGTTWHVTLIRRSNWFNPVREAQRGRGFEVNRQSHTGVVWCPTTPNGTFLARRRGTVYWTGNSMEAVPRQIGCVVDGCGLVADYVGRSSDTYCEHMAAPTGKKRLIAPHFNAGAIIVPPVRPGWKRADINEISQLLQGRPDVADLYEGLAASAPHLGPQAWETLMNMLVIEARDFSRDQRKKLAKTGVAMPDGSFPIPDADALRRAIKLAGNAKDPAAARRHIIRRAKALGLTKLIPEGWAS